jgi:hypothetical protein
MVMSIVAVAQVKHLSTKNKRLASTASGYRRCRIIDLPCGFIL